MSQHRGELNFLAHKDHYWIDQAITASQNYFEDRAKNAHQIPFLAENKSQELRLQLKKILQTRKRENFLFYENVNDFLFELTHSLHQEEVHILTTDADHDKLLNHSLHIDTHLKLSVEIIELKPFRTFYARLGKILKTKPFHILYLSQAPPTYGYTLDINEILNITNFLRPKASLEKIPFHFIVDGTTSFLTKPFSLEKIEDQLIYIGHANSYAQSGEGLCFAHASEDVIYDLFTTREFLQAYPQPYNIETLYRFSNFLGTLEDHKISTEKINSYIKEQQRLFLNEIQSLNNPLINMNSLILHDITAHGAFFVFELNDPTLSAELANLMRLQKVYCECNGSRLIFGFGLYNPGPYDLSILNIITDDLLT